MQKKLTDFLLYANQILKPDKEIPDGLDESVKQLIANTVEVTELSSKDIRSLMRFAEIGDTHKVVYLFSVLLHTVKNNDIFQHCAKYAYLHRDDYHIYSQYFLYSQIKAMAFEYGYELPEYYDTWILEISNVYVEYFHDELSLIDFQDRKKDFILVITSQLLNPFHSPTKIALDICFHLIKSGRIVLLLNVADVLSMTGCIAFLCKQAYYIEDYLNTSEYVYKGLGIPLFQCEKGMPNIDGMYTLINEIRQIKPEMILSIGEDVFSNVIDDMIPCCSIPLEAGVCHNYTKYLVHYNDISAKEYERLEKYGYKDENLIKMKLPFQIEKTSGLKREDLGIPEAVFCLIMIGNRLEAELTNEFLSMLDSVLKRTDFILLTVGNLDCEAAFSEYQSITEKNIHIEYTDKLLAVCDLTDLYINPPRKGGGTSAIYAMAAGKPVVTLKYGDVYENCGEEFSADNIEMMREQIIRYKEDDKYYSMMSQVARGRADLYTNMEKTILEMVENYEKREAE